NIHPILLFDERDADQVKRVLAASHEILEECLHCGGSVTGEHGIGVEKIDFMPKLFGPEDLAMMLRLRAAFNPDNRCSPHKMFPTAGACIEPSKAGRRAALWTGIWQGRTSDASTNVGRTGRPAGAAGRPAAREFQRPAVFAHARNASIRATSRPAARELKQAGIG